MRTAKATTTLLAVLAATTLCAGCVAHAHGYTYAEAEPVVFEEPPTLVAIDSGVWVVPRYHRAVYYYDDAYWVYEGGGWYRSSYYDGGWASVDVNIVPSVIVHRPHSRYVYYEATAGAQVRTAPRASIRHSGPHKARRERGPYPGYATPDEPTRGRTHRRYRD